MPAMTPPAPPTLAAAQQDLRQAYADGAPGVLASALAWALAGAVALARGPAAAVWALLIAGMFIHPLSLLLCKALGRSARHAAGNPLGTLALHGTLAMLLCLPLAVVVARHRVDWFFAAMLLIIGGRYLSFATLYGRRLYLLLGASLALAALALVLLRAPAAVGAWSGALLEAGFAAALWRQARTAHGGAGAAAADASAPTGPGGDAALLAHLVALEQRRTQALVARDLATAGPLHAPGYQLITPAGRVFERDAYLQAVADGELAYAAWEMGPAELRHGGTLALLRYPARLRFAAGRELALWHTDAYAQQDGQWRVVWSQATARAEPAA
jgi:Domain of unknown function (DUF4440)